MKLLIFGSVLLLCGLLSNSQSLGGSQVSSVVDLDVDVLQNAVGSALQQNGLLTGLLGKVLGGGSSSGGRQGGLLGGLLGGNNGLLGNVLGGDLLSLEVTDAQILGVTLQFVNPDGLKIGIDVSLAVKANLIGSNLLDVKVKVHIAGNTKMVVNNAGSLVITPQSCEISTQIETGLLPALEGPVNELLNKALPDVLCPVIDLVAPVLSGLLGNVNTLLPVDGLGALQYTLANTPLATDNGLLLGLNLGLVGSSGKSFQFPAIDASSLPLRQSGDGTSKVFFSKDILTSLLRLHLNAGNLNLHLKEGVSGILDISILRSLLPPGTLPANVPLEAKVEIKDVQVVAFDNGRATINLVATVDVFAQTASGPKSLFAVDITARLTGTVDVTGTALSFSLTVDDVSVSVSSSAVGAIDVSVLENWATNLIDGGIVAKLNELLSLPVPNIANLTPVSGSVSTDGDVIAVNLIPAAA